MSEMGDLASQLIRLQGAAKAANTQAGPIRQKLLAMLLERYEDEGVDRLNRDDGLVSLIKPEPYVQVTAPGALCGWLDTEGHGNLVREVPHILDADVFCDAVKLMIDVAAGEASTRAKVEALEAIEHLLPTVDLAAEPVNDWHEHLTWEATDDGTLVTPDGEPIPGCRYVVPPIKSLVVRPDKGLVEREQQRLGGAE